MIDWLLGMPLILCWRRLNIVELRRSCWNFSLINLKNSAEHAVSVRGSLQWDHAAWNTARSRYRTITGLTRRRVSWCRDTEFTAVRDNMACSLDPAARHKDRLCGYCLLNCSHNHRRTVVPPCVNGDLAVEWEWSKFDPSQNPNPLTDYDKTLHNWLRPRDERGTQNVCQSVLRERLINTWNITPIFCNFFSGSPTEVTHSASNTQNHARVCLLGGLNDGRQHLGVKIFQNGQNWTLMCYLKRLNCAQLSNDVIDEWRHWRRYCAWLRTNFRRSLPNVP